MALHASMCILLCVCQVGSSGFSLGSLIDGTPPPPPPPQPKCSSFIKFPNGTETKYHVADFLRSERAIRCSSSISTALEKMFEDGDESTKIREDTLDRSLCSAFVDLFSVVAYHPGLTVNICAFRMLSERSLNYTDFCGNEGPRDEEMDTAVVSNVEMFGSYFMPIASEVMKLQSLDKTTCPGKCGSGYSRILCNAFYPMATLLSREYPTILATESQGN